MKAKTFGVGAVLVVGALMFGLVADKGRRVSAPKDARETVGRAAK